MKNGWGFYPSALSCRAIASSSLAHTYKADYDFDNVVPIPQFGVSMTLVMAIPFAHKM